MGRLMDGWVDEWVDGWVDGWIAWISTENVCSLVSSMSWYGSKECYHYAGVCACVCVCVCVCVGGWREGGFPQ